MTTDTPITAGEIETTLQPLLRPDLAEDWDNVGLLVGRRDRDVTRMMLCIDLSAGVLREALARRAEFVLAYHPPIFDGLKRILADSTPVIYRAVREDLAVYAIHTAFDMIPGGTSDCLADIIDLRDRRPIAPAQRADQSKLVVFTPVDAADKVASALFDVGAGRIGRYAKCSFRTPGTGTFQGDETTHPAVGTAGAFETADELRLEVVVDNARLPGAITAVKRAHPYEEVAFDVYGLTDVADDVGLGRVGRLPRAVTLKTIVKRIKQQTELEHVQVAKPSDAGKITTAAVCPGSCGKVCHGLAGKVDLYVTGELRHHDALLLQSKGTAVVCLGHGNSERMALQALAGIVKRELPHVTPVISSRDSDPLQIM